MTPSEQALADARQFVEPEPEFAVVDRSTLETYATCPAQGRFLETGAVLSTSKAMVSGDLAHGCLSRATRDYVDSRGAMSLTDLVDVVLQDAAMSRPDLQPDVVRSLTKGAVWPWAKFLTDMHHANILRFDGGDGDRSGQLAWDMPELKLRITSEVDLLHAGPSPQVLHEVDYKTGKARWTAESVKDAFQFALHAWLILKNYPEPVDAVLIRVWNTQTGGPTYPVLYKRADLFTLEARVRSAALAYAQNRSKAPQDAQTWPTVEKCPMCPAAALCPAAGPLMIPESMTDPHALVDALVAREANVAALRKLAIGMVTEAGEDIVTPSGNAFGTGKPKANRRPTMSLYSATASPQESSDEDCAS